MLRWLLSITQVGGKTSHLQKLHLCCSSQQLRFKEEDREAGRHHVTPLRTLCEEEEQGAQVF